MLDNYVNTAISKNRILKRVPKNSRVPLAESLSDKIIDIVYNVEDVTKWLILFNVVLVFFGATEKKWTQTDHKHELFDKQKNSSKRRVTSKTHPQVSSPPLSDLKQRIKLISSKLDEGNLKGGIRPAASDDKIAPFSTDNYQKLLSKHP